VLEHKWGTITSKGARWSWSQHWGACARRTAFGRAEVRDGVELYCEMRKTGAALTSDDGLPVGHSWGTRVYRRGTGSGWPPLGAATGANEPHTHLGMVI